MTFWEGYASTPLWWKGRMSWFGWVLESDFFFIMVFLLLLGLQENEAFSHRQYGIFGPTNVHDQ